MTEAFDPSDGPGFGLVFPMLPVVSHGGPFDDRAYVCGWEAGTIAALLDMGQHNPTRLELPVHAENIDQLDLVAMHYGFVMDHEPWEDDPSWVFVRFSKPSG